MLQSGNRRNNFINEANLDGHSVFSLELCSQMLKMSKKKLVRYVFHTDVEKHVKPRICIENRRQIGLAEDPHMTRNLLARQTRALLHIPNPPCFFISLLALQP